MPGITTAAAPHGDSATAGIAGTARRRGDLKRDEAGDGDYIFAIADGSGGGSGRHGTAARIMKLLVLLLQAISVTTLPLNAASPHPEAHSVSDHASP